MTEPMTMEQLRDYAEWHVQNGRGQSAAMLDPRGLIYLNPQHHKTVGIAAPHGDDTHADGKVFLRAVF